MKLNQKMVMSVFLSLSVTQISLSADLLEPASLEDQLNQARQVFKDLSKEVGEKNQGLYRAKSLEECGCVMGQLSVIQKLMDQSAGKILELRQKMHDQNK
jgi:hypothetical protein